MNRHFRGRTFSISCKSNRVGCFMEIAIFGSKRRLKTLMIPAGNGCAGLKSLADVLATSTTGPERRIFVPDTQATSTLPNYSHATGEVARPVQSTVDWTYAEVIRPLQPTVDRTYAEVVAKGRSMSEPTEE